MAYDDHHIAEVATVVNLHSLRTFERKQQVKDIYNAMPCKQARHPEKNRATFRLSGASQIKFSRDNLPYFASGRASTYPFETTLLNIFSLAAFFLFARCPTYYEDIWYF